MSVDAVPQSDVALRIVPEFGGRVRDVGEDGLLRSKVFPGLWLDSDALWNKKKSLRNVVGLGLQSADHTAFVKKFAAARRRK